jgi:hypothetical protein
LYASIADNDYFRLRVGGTATNAGYVEIATSDDGTEPIYVRQYTGVFSSITRTATLLDGSGNTSFPGTITAPTFSGALSGNATTATTAGALTSMNISQFTNNSAYITGISFANVSSKPTTISGYGITDAITTANIGSQSVSFATSATSATTAGSAPNAGNLNASYGVSTGGGNGLKFWGGSDLYKIHMGSSAEYYYGPVTDYSIKCNIDSNGSTRGFTWGQSGVTPIAALNVGNGNYQIAGTFTSGGSILPLSNGTLNLGSSGARWNTLFTSDLSLSNGIGDYTIVEGEDDLFLYNNKRNKVYKFMLQEVKPEDATPKRPE